MKGRQHIALLLLLAFFAYLSHAMVPHHHHDGVLRHTEESNCTHSHDHEDAASHDHEEEAPLHCHAFNNLVFEKYRSGVQKLEPTYLAFTLPSEVCLHELPGPERTTFNYFKAHPPEALPPGSCSPRAPPVCA